MRIGLHALGIGAGARPEVIRAVASAAEAAGFATLWAGEHVVLVDQPTSRYPYSPDGRIAVPADADWLDPLLALSFAAAVTTTIVLATGVLLLPEHNPVVAAKQAATLDVLSAGRLTLGLGIGWSSEEFAALGVPFPRRAQRTVATFGDGWYGFNLPVAAVAERVEALTEQCQLRKRNPRDLTVAVAVSDGTPADVRDLAEIGVTELVLVAAPPPDPPAATAWVHDLAAQWNVTPHQPRY
jgi:alkanesulfonate monooxygenase SsuD/methylene tetrahydromethanopterin reductase-like flavin-dependent oxidoreductase (luciferase family)